jgi:gliding motility-associated protein GldE
MIVLVVFSAFFSASETAFFSIDKTSLKLFQSSDQKSAKRVAKLLEDPQELLITILIGNNIVNVLIAMLSTLFTKILATTLQVNLTIFLTLNVAFVTIVILFGGEIFPKIFAIRNNTLFVQRTAVILQIIRIVFFPITFIFKKLAGNFTNYFSIKLKPSSLNEEELKTLFDLSEESGALQNDEREMLTSIIDFSETTVKEIMVPRVDMECVRIDESIEKIIDLIKINSHSRIPVYEERIDDIKGIIYAKDLIKFLPEIKDINISELLHEVHFVPEQKRIQELLKEFQDKKIHMAIVVDEYGGTSGLVTLEDIIEEIVGEIQDEYDKEEPLFIKKSENKLELDGRLSIEELNEILPKAIEDPEGIETISGFIHHLTGNLPNENDIIDFENYHFKIQKVDSRRISKIELLIDASNN